MTCENLRGGQAAGGLSARLTPFATRSLIFLLSLAAILSFGPLMSQVDGVSPSLDHVVERAVLRDRDGSLDIEQAAASEFSPIGEFLAGGYSSSVFWLRIVVERPASAGRLILRVRPTYLDEVSLYERTKSGGWKSGVTGDRVAFAERPLDTVSLGFEIEPAAPRSVYFLRLKTTSTSLLSVTALKPRIAASAEFRAHAVTALYVMISIWVWLWTMHECLLRPSALTLWFAALQVVYLSYIVALRGYLAPVVPTGPAWLVDGTTSFLVFLAPLFCFAFDRSLARNFGPAWFAPWISVLLVAAAIAVPSLLVAGEPGWALRVNGWFTLMGVPLFLVLALAPDDGRTTRPVSFRMIYGLQAVSLIVTMVPLLGLVEASDWNVNAAMLHGGIYVCLMFVLLHRSSRDMQASARDNRLMLEIANQSLRTERREREVQNRFVAMLTHEIKTPLSVIKLSMDRRAVAPQVYGAVSEALVDIEAIIDRCNLADQIDQAAMTIESEPMVLGDALAEMLERTGGSQHFRLSVPDDLEIVCDRRMLSIIMGNLADNAEKYSVPGQPILVEAESADSDGAKGVIIRVSNSVRSGRAPDPERVFEKFYRGPGAQAKGGSGLGLYIVEGLVALLGGRVRCRAEEDFVIFDLWLPSGAGRMAGAPAHSGGVDALVERDGRG